MRQMNTKDNHSWRAKTFKDGRRNPDTVRKTRNQEIGERQQKYELTEA